jgi:hypothetical protein
MKKWRQKGKAAGGGGANRREGNRNCRGKKQQENQNKKIVFSFDRLCGLVVRVLDYRSGGSGLIPGTTRKKKSSGFGLSLVSYLIEK